jgi:hypothetical protein
MATRALTFLALAVAASAACSAPPSHDGFTEANATGTGGTSSSGSSGGSGNNGSSSGTFGDSDAGSSTSGGSCNPNAANAEIADNQCDDDADGQVDNVPVCDNGLAIDGAAGDFAKAIGVCDQASSRGFGVVSAVYSNGFGRTAAPHTGQWGLLPRFGSVLGPREGQTIGALSSGYAREFDSPSGGGTPFFDIGPLDGQSYPTGAAPNGFPRAAAGCQQDNLVNDMIDVKLTLKAPPNAQGFKFDFDFHSSEWPAFICTNFNDAFVAYLSAPSFNGGSGDNVSFDSKNNPVSVNNGFFDRCTPSSPIGCGDGNSPTGTAACPGGPSELAGTGFGITSDPDNAPVCASGQSVGGATGWLTTQAKVAAGEQFTLEFMIWDAGDGVLDSLVLIDKFQWIGGAVTPGTTRPPR